MQVCVSLEANGIHQNATETNSHCCYGNHANSNITDSAVAKASRPYCRILRLLVESSLSQFDQVDCRQSYAGSRLIEIDHRISRLHCPATPANPIHRDHRPPATAASSLLRWVPSPRLSETRAKEIKVGPVGWMATHCTSVTAVFHQSIIYVRRRRTLHVFVRYAQTGSIDAFQTRKQRRKIDAALRSRLL